MYNVLSENKKKLLSTIHPETPCHINKIFVGDPLNEGVENDLLLPTFESYGHPRLSISGNGTNLISPLLSPLPKQPMSADDAICSNFAASSKTERCSDRHSISRQSLMGKIHLLIKTF